MRCRSGVGRFRDAVKNKTGRVLRIFLGLNARDKGLLYLLQARQEDCKADGNARGDYRVMVSMRTPSGGELVAEMLHIIKLCELVFM